MKMMFLFLAMVVGMTSSKLSRADSDDDLSSEVLQWVKDGKVKSLESLLTKHKNRIHGRLLDVEVEEMNGRIIYELQIIRKNLVIYEIKLDARTGEWLQEEIEN